MRINQKIKGENVSILERFEIEGSLVNLPSIIIFRVTEQVKLRLSFFFVMGSIEQALENKVSFYFITYKASINNQNSCM